MNIALIHDWYYTYGGAEQVVKSINNLWPETEHYALVDFLGETDRNEILGGKEVCTSFLQNIPTARSNHRKFLQWFPKAIEQFDLRKYDLLLSSSSSVAKGVLTHQNQLHICYCHSPARYAWDLYFQYLEESGLNKGLKGAYARRVLRNFRNWDYLSHPRVDHFIANSHYIARRIYKVYRREAEVIYPPVDTEFYQCKEQKGDYYFTASRMVPYKRIDEIVRAFNKMPERKLIVAGDGPDFHKIKKEASDNVQFLGYVGKQELKKYMQEARAFLFMAEEDFGIIPVEAQACGTPVIGYGKGGVLETVIDGRTGIHFMEQSEESLRQGIQRFEQQTFDARVIRKHAEGFSRTRFESEYKTFVMEKYREFKNN
ncbi:glycosyltransferase [Robiginitalea sp. IMCC44478]|uniref:glycosyltransferase n=1 Tax=Robiginitalea sp. IMCC44478 TaxID=3459122 RepID=UPI0040435739